MKRAYAKLGGQLGLLCIGIGFLVIGLAWNGAAGVDFVSGQIPYLLSGGFLGISLVVLGVGLVVVENSRKDRSKLESELRELNTGISRLAAAIAGGSGTNGSSGGRISHEPGEVVLLGRSSFHLPSCRLADGKELPESTYDAAVAEGLSACRICNPDPLLAETAPSTQ